MWTLLERLDAAAWLLLPAIATFFFVRNVLIHGYLPELNLFSNSTKWKVFTDFECWSTVLWQCTTSGNVS